MRRRERGVVLLVCLMLVLLLGLLGLSAMSSAATQARMAGNQAAALGALERAEALLRVGEGETLPVARCSYCLPPPEAGRVRAAGIHPGEGGSGLPWTGDDSGFYLIQQLGESSRAVGMPDGAPVTLYRITVIGRQGPARAVLESIFARPLVQGATPERRIAWRQIH